MNKRRRWKAKHRRKYAGYLLGTFIFTPESDLLSFADLFVANIDPNYPVGRV